VFFYPHNQEELIGTNGLESMRAPFLSTRVNVVLYRERYGKTPWTGVELAAIQDSCLKTGFRSLLFVQLEKKDGKPDWLPDTHIRCVLDDFTIEQLVGAIKNKVQELGGVIHRLDAMSEAERVKREAEYLADRDAMMRDRTWIERDVFDGPDLTRKPGQGRAPAAVVFTRREKIVVATNRTPTHGYEPTCEPAMAAFALINRVPDHDDSQTLPQRVGQ